MKKYLIVALIPFLAACAATSGADTSPAPAVTVTKEVEVQVEQESSVRSSEDLDAEVTALALEMAWSDLSATDQADVCFYYGLDPDDAWDAFSGSTSEYLTKTQFIEFFDSVC